VRTLDELIDRDDDAWPIFVDWGRPAGAAVGSMALRSGGRQGTLLAVQVTTHSIMGAVALRCGGIRIDHGWLRILGAGGEGIGGGLVQWNALSGGKPLDPPWIALFLSLRPAGRLLRHERRRAWPGEPGIIHYLAAGHVRWEPMGVGYSPSSSGDVRPAQRFYEGQRWEGWEQRSNAFRPTRSLDLPTSRVRTGATVPSGAGAPSRLVRCGTSPTTLAGSLPACARRGGLNSAGLTDAESRPRRRGRRPGSLVRMDRARRRASFPV